MNASITAKQVLSTIPSKDSSGREFQPPKCLSQPTITLGTPKGKRLHKNGAASIEIDFGAGYLQTIFGGRSGEDWDVIVCGAVA
jgi:hypothetical protein